MATKKQMTVQGANENLFTEGKCNIISFFANESYRETKKEKISVSAAITYVKNYLLTEQEKKHIIAGEKWLNIQAVLVENQNSDDLSDDENTLIVAENTFGY